MPDRFSTMQPSLSGPASSAFPLTPNDTFDLTETSRALYVGGAGKVSVRMLTGETATFSNVLAGSILPLRITRLLATNTTATGILALV